MLRYLTNRSYVDFEKLQERQQTAVPTTKQQPESQITSAQSIDLSSEIIHPSSVTPSSVSNQFPANFIVVAEQSPEMDHLSVVTDEAPNDSSVFIKESSVVMKDSLTESPVVTNLSSSKSPVKLTQSEDGSLLVTTDKAPTHSSVIRVQSADELQVVIHKSPVDSSLLTNLSLCETLGDLQHKSCENTAASEVKTDQLLSVPVNTELEDQLQIHTVVNR